MVFIYFTLGSLYFLGFICSACLIIHKHLYNNSIPHIYYYQMQEFCYICFTKFEEKIKQPSAAQLSISAFSMLFEYNLNPENHWVLLSRIVEQDVLAREYYKNITSKKVVLPLMLMRCWAQ